MWWQNSFFCHFWSVSADLLMSYGRLLNFFMFFIGKRKLKFWQENCFGPFWFLFSVKLYVLALSFLPFLTVWIHLLFYVMIMWNCLPSRYHSIAHLFKILIELWLFFITSLMCYVLQKIFDLTKSSLFTGKIENTFSWSGSKRMTFVKEVQTRSSWAWWRRSFKEWNPCMMRWVKDCLRLAGRSAFGLQLRQAE